jgi:hypothetical protein
VDGTSSSRSCATARSSPPAPAGDSSPTNRPRYPPGGVCSPARTRLRCRTTNLLTLAGGDPRSRGSMVSMARHENRSTPSLRHAVQPAAGGQHRLVGRAQRPRPVGRRQRPLGDHHGGHRPRRRAGGPGGRRRQQQAHADGRVRVPGQAAPRQGPRARSHPGHRTGPTEVAVDLRDHHRLAHATARRRQRAP